jgi:hypothetical protein
MRPSQSHRAALQLPTNGNNPHRASRAEFASNGSELRLLSTFRFSGAFAASLYVAGQGLIGGLAAETMARCRRTWPDKCRRWLPVWLPKIVAGRRQRAHDEFLPVEVKSGIADLVGRTEASISATPRSASSASRGWADEVTAHLVAGIGCAIDQGDLEAPGCEPGGNRRPQPAPTDDDGIRILRPLNANSHHPVIGTSPAKDVPAVLPTVIHKAG